MSYRLPVFLMTVLMLLGTANAFSAENELLPSEAATLMNQAMRHQPDAERRSITGPLIARMRTEDLSEMETFFKGEAHFLNFEPEPSRDAFLNFRDRSDSLGRVATQRLMIIRINAFGMVDELLEKDIPEHRRRFPVQANDRYGITFPVNRTASLLIEQGRADEALDLIAEHVKLHDRFDSAYTAYRLPGQFLNTAKENGRGAEFIALHEQVVSGLESAIEKRLASKAGTVEEVDRLPGVVFFTLFEDGDLSYHRWTAEMIELVEQLKAAAEQSE